MSSQTRILVVYHDLSVLSRIYLALVHRNYKAEASDKWMEIHERIKRFRPSVIILGKSEYLHVKDSLKIPGIVLVDGDETPPELPGDFLSLKQPVPIDNLLSAIASLVI